MYEHFVVALPIEGFTGDGNLSSAQSLSQGAQVPAAAMLSGIIDCT